MTGFERYRRKALLTQADLAELLGISSQAISKWESRKGYPKTPTLQELSRLYNVPIEDLLRDDYPDKDLEDAAISTDAKGA